MKYGFFDNANREYVITRLMSRLRGQTTWVLRNSVR